MQETMIILCVASTPAEAKRIHKAISDAIPQAHLEITHTQAEALNRLEEKGYEYEIVLTDYHLPDGSGISLLSYIRENCLTMAVVMLLEKGDTEAAVAVLKSGANDYLVKRDDYLERLPAILDKAIKRYKAEEARRARPLKVLYLDRGSSGEDDVLLRHFSNHAPHIHLEKSALLNRNSPLESQIIQNWDCDVILLDFRPSELCVLELLMKHLHEREEQLPIVLVAEQDNEDAAVQALRLGASDFIIKSEGYLSRLPGLIENAYYRTQLFHEQAALRASEERFRRLAENAPDIIYRYRIIPTPGFEYISPAVTGIVGYTPEEFYTQNDLMVGIVFEEDKNLLMELFSGRRTTEIPIILRVNRKDGNVVWIEVRSVPLRNEAGDLVAAEGICRDITDRKIAEERSQRQLRRLNALRSVDTAITTSLDPEVTLEILLEHVLMQLGVHAASILSYDPYTQSLQYALGTGFRTSLIHQTRLRLGDKFAGQAALERKTVSVQSNENVESCKGFANLIQEEGFVAYWGTPLLAKSHLKGVLEVYSRTTINPDNEWLNFFETLAKQAAIAMDNAELVANLQKVNQEVLLAYDTTLEGWVRALDLRDQETQSHTQRVVDLTVRLARMAGITETALVNVRRGALLHDIGKIGIPDTILHKPGPLNAEEWEIMRKHPIYAFELLSPIEYLRQAVDIPYCHHEKWDGTGYPRQLRGDQIPQPARLFAVVDVWEALSSDRPYRRAWEDTQVLEYIRAQSGIQFDPTAVEMFFQVLGNI